MVSFLFLLLKPILFLMLKKFFKKQMKAFIITAIEWLVLQTDNDLDDKILEKVKKGMKLGMVWTEPFNRSNLIFRLNFFRLLLSVFWIQSVHSFLRKEWSLQAQATRARFVLIVLVIERFLESLFYFASNSLMQKVGISLTNFFIWKRWIIVRLLWLAVDCLYCLNGLLVCQYEFINHSITSTHSDICSYKAVTL